MSQERLTRIHLDEASLGARSPESEHERGVAVADLLAENRFAPRCWQEGPYGLELSMREGRLQLVISNESGDTRQVAFAVTPLKRIARDYAMICESYYEALKTASPGKIETLDMARRGVHNEGAEALKELLEERIEVDFATARRLFTLVCVLLSK